MKRVATLLMIVLATLTASGQSNSAATAKLSPAEQHLAAANRMLAANPKNYEAYNAQALALSQRARETSDRELLQAG